MKAIEVRGLDFQYPGSSAKVIRDMNFSVSAGEIFGFLGPSGAGKSTTQNILIGILKGYQGKVKVLGEEATAISREFYEHIGVAFEFPNFYAKFTGLENLDYFRSLYRGETLEPRQLLAQVGLSEHGHVRVSKYSKGMKMRLNLCRALLNRPQLLFLDEPTSGLDPANARRMREIILEQKAQGRTVFLTTHNMTVAAEICDRVAFVVDGSIPLVDSPRDLMVKHGQRRVRVEHQEQGGIITGDYDLAGLGTNQNFLSLLRENRIVTMHTREASLDDIFIQVTGRSLDHGADALSHQA